MSWQNYVENLMADGSCQDAAIVGHGEPKYVWASHPGGPFAGVTATEIEAIMCTDRNGLLTNGLTLGSKKCSVIRDQLQGDDGTMDIRTKTQGGEPTYNVSVGRAAKVLVMVMGKEGIHGGTLNKKTYTMTEYLKQSGY
ncbi:profilin-2-like [Dunckerocampus dactyliophorus]|uniref:profilin-2-like n=1 Tax=Dunckerocampus dactyliophorus TaxID=161453 RepID=UPI0024053FEA|nr:profilin-2-like [Dunckerocampus dactyliophorus]